VPLVSPAVVTCGTCCGDTLRAYVVRVQVTRIAAQIQARAYGCSTVAPQSEPIWGVPEAVAPFNGSAIFEYRYADVPPIPTTNTAPSKASDTHHCISDDVRQQQQVRDFIEHGVVSQYCSETDGCLAPTCPTGGGWGPH
jgi:hypothetical protein